MTAIHADISRFLIPGSTPWPSSTCRPSLTRTLRGLNFNEPVPSFLRNIEGSVERLDAGIEELFQFEVDHGAGADCRHF